MRKLYAEGYDVADNLIAACAGAQYILEPGDKILDFGCGAGALVYRLRDLGFDAYGFEIHDRVAYRNPEDRRFFGFIDNPSSDTSATVVDREIFKVPFEDNTFDLVVSTSVLEHVMDLPPMISETARILKPSGFAWHLYPNKSVLVEPHIYVPFSSRFQNWWYFYAWGLLGVRNEYQEKMSAREVADNNVLYTRTGLRYYTRQELLEVCSQHFEQVRFVDDLWYPDVAPSIFWKNRARALRKKFPLREYSRNLKMGSLLTAQKIAR